MDKNKEKISFCQRAEKGCNRIQIAGFQLPVTYLEIVADFLQVRNFAAVDGDKALFL